MMLDIVGTGLGSKFLVVCVLVERSPYFCAFGWPLWVIKSDGGYRLTCLVVNSENTVKYLASIALVSVARVRENNDA